MSCDAFQEKLSEWLDGRVHGSEKRLLEQHLRECAGCRQVQQQLSAVHKSGKEALHDYGRSEAYWRGLADRIAAAVPAKGSVAESAWAGWWRRKRTPLWRTAALAGALVLLLLITRLNYNSETLLQPIFIDDSTAVQRPDPAPVLQMQKSEQKELTRAALPSHRDQLALLNRESVQQPVQTMAASSPDAVSKSKADPVRDASPVGGVAPSSTMEPIKAAGGSVAAQQRVMENSATATVPISSEPSGANPLSVYGVTARRNDVHVTRTESLSLDKSAGSSDRAAQQLDDDRQFVMQTLAQELAAEDTVTRPGADAHKISIEQKKQRTVRTAELLYNLVVVNRIKSMQEPALRFYHAYQQVLQDSLGAAKYQARLLQIKSAP